MENKVEELAVDFILKKSQINVRTVFSKATIVTVQLPNGFVIVESSGAVSPENYDLKMGKEICMDRIKSKIWELEGYKLASILAEKEQEE